MSKKSPEHIVWKFGRNKSWRESMSLGVRAGLIWAPTTLYNTIRAPLIAAIGGTLLSGAILLAWGISRFLVFTLGLAGFVSAAEEEPHAETAE